MIAIQINNLTKRFDRVTAVDRVSLDIQQGEIFGLLGPNGAGKTTIIQMLATLLHPSAGEAKVSGFSVLKERNQVRKCLGIVFQEPTIDEKLTGWENMDFHARMYGLSRVQRQKRIEEMLTLVDLMDKRKVLMKNYSQGMKRRLEIARGLVHKPQVLFLDEPTLGLDPQTRRHIWKYIRELNQKAKTTVVLTTHYLEEADALCSRVGIIDLGKIAVVDRPAALKTSVGCDVLLLETVKVKLLIQALKKTSWAKKVMAGDRQVTVEVDQGETKVMQAVKLAQQSNIPLEAISLRKPTLEDVFLHYTGSSIRGS